MSINIQNLPEDLDVTLNDKFVGVNSSDNKAYNYKLQEITNIIAAKTGSAITTDNIKTVTETAPGNWLTVLNASNPVWTINPADVAFLEVLDTGGSFSALYIYVKATTGVEKVGLGETAVTADDFLALRLANDVGEANTLAEVGTGDVSVVVAKSAEELRMKSLKQGSNVTLSETATDITIAAAAPGEVNTASNVGSGAEVFKQKTGEDLEFRELVGINCDVGVSGDNVEIQPWGKIVRSSSFIVSSTDSQRTIHIDNGASAVIITIPDTLSTGFEMGVQQIGTGEVSFAVSGTATLEYTENKLKGQGATCFVETLGDDKDRILITGDTKA